MHHIDDNYQMVLVHMHVFRQVQQLIETEWNNFSCARVVNSNEARHPRENLLSLESCG